MSFSTFFLGLVVFVLLVEDFFLVPVVDSPDLAVFRAAVFLVVVFLAAAVLRVALAFLAETA